MVLKMSLSNRFKKNTKPELSSDIHMPAVAHVCTHTHTINLILSISLKVERVGHVTS